MTWRRSVALAAVAVAAIVTGCSGPSGPPPTPDEGQRAAREQTFGPAYPATAPAGEPRRIEKASLSPDGLTLTVEFIGGPGYLASDMCATDYEPWLQRGGEKLNVEIIQISHPEQATFGPNTGCDAIGYPWIFQLALAEPFHGTTVNDLAIGRSLDVEPAPETSPPSTPLPTQAAGPTGPVILDLFERSFGPTYPPLPPEGRSTKIDGVSLSSDRMTLTVTFVGGYPYDDAHPDRCATRYQPWVIVRDDQLDVAVMQVAQLIGRQSGEPTVFCTLQGHTWVFHLLLLEPFQGTRVNDVAGGSFEVDPA